MSNLKERIEHIEREKEWLDGRVREIFTKYCEIYGIFLAHGIDSWEIWGNALDIRQDITCRGCYDTESHTLPVEYLYTEDYEPLIKRDFEKHQQEEKERKVKELEYEIQKTTQQLKNLQERRNGQ